MGDGFLVPPTKEKTPQWMSRPFWRRGVNSGARGFEAPQNCLLRTAIAGHVKTPAGAGVFTW